MGVDQMGSSQIIRGRERPRKAIIDIIMIFFFDAIKKDLEIHELDNNMVYDKSIMVTFDSCSQPHLVEYGLVVVVATC
jgi:hypothetical protein